MDNQSEVQSIAESQISRQSQKSFISKENLEIIEKIELNQEDREFLKFLDAKLRNTEQKIQSVQNNLKQQNTQKAETTNKKAEDVLRNSTFDFKKQDVKGSLEENYIELYTKHKKLEMEMKKMSGKFQEKNNQISMLIQEVKKRQQSEELCIKKIADLTLKLEKYENGETPVSDNQQTQVVKKPRKKNQLNNSKQYSQSIGNQYQINNTYKNNNNNNYNSGFQNKLDENLKKEDPYNFWMDDQQKQEEKALKVKAMNKNKHTLDDVLGQEKNEELWLHQHNLRRNYRENQEEQLAQKYGQTLYTDEQQQQLQSSNNTSYQQSKSGTPSVRTPQQSNYNYNPQGATYTTNKTQLRPLDSQTSQLGNTYVPKTKNRILK